MLVSSEQEQFEIFYNGKSLGKARQITVNTDSQKIFAEFNQPMPFNENAYTTCTINDSKEDKKSIFSRILNYLFGV